MLAKTYTGKETMSWWDHVQIYVNTINHIIIVIVSLATTYICWHLGPTAFSQHAWLSTIGYQLLMCEGIMSLYSHNSWSALHTRRTQTNIHWILQAIGSGMAIAGSVLYYLQRDQHLVTTHAVLGFISLIFTGIGLLNGTSALWARELRRLTKPAYARLVHNVVGLLAFTIGMASLVFGFNNFELKLEAIVTLQILCGLTIFMSQCGVPVSLKRLVEGAFPDVCYKKECEIEDGEAPVVQARRNSVLTIIKCDDDDDYSMSKSK